MDREKMHKSRYVMGHVGHRMTITFYVIVRVPDGKFVTVPGSKHSYSRSVNNARRFASVEAASGDLCGNERVLRVEVPDHN